MAGPRQRGMAGKLQTAVGKFEEQALLTTNWILNSFLLPSVKPPKPQPHQVSAES